jgi:hypothetical protein
MGTKLGLHVTFGPRRDYGLVCAEAPAVVTAVGEGNALIEVAEKSGGRTITIFREQTVFHDAPPNLPQMSEAQARAAADEFWPRLREKYAMNPADYYQPVNETGGDDRVSLRNIIAFEMRLMELAEADGMKLAVGSPAGGSPGSFELWKEFYVPLLRRAEAGGHLYSRHVYGGVASSIGTLTVAGPAAADGNARRPFDEAVFLRQEGIHIPMVLTEAGQHAGFRFPNVDEFMEDMARFDQLCQQHENIWGFCCWTYGRYDSPEGHSANIEPASARLAEYLRQQGGAVRPKYPQPSPRRVTSPTTPEVVTPQPPPLAGPGLVAPQPATVAGFLWDQGIEKRGDLGLTTMQLRLREGPFESERQLGSVAKGKIVSLTGTTMGNEQTKYYPVLVAAGDVIPVATPPKPDRTGGHNHIADNGVTVTHHVGIHDRADRHPLPADYEIFARGRFSHVKVQTGITAEEINAYKARGAKSFVVRLYQSVRPDHHRSPQQFFDDVKNDYDRLYEMELYDVELHNEPNLTVEGLAMKQYYGSWKDGADYAAWLTELIRLFRGAYPKARMGLSALSPGKEATYENSVQGHGWRMNEDQFMTAMIDRGIADKVDFVCVHAYYGSKEGIQEALAHVQKYRDWFPSKPIAITEHTCTDRSAPPTVRGALARQFVEGLNGIPGIMSSAYYIVSGEGWHEALRTADGASTGILEAWRS